MAASMRDFAHLGVDKGFGALDLHADDLPAATRIESDLPG